MKNPDVVEGAADLRTLLTHDFWGRDISEGLSHKSWRPLTTLTFRWNYLTGGLEVGPYHAVNLALHTAVSLAFLALVHRASGGLGGGELRGCAAISACLFAVHPVHTEAVTGVVGRAELLSALFLLWSLLSYSYGAGLRAALLALLSHACKETGLLALALCLWMELALPSLVSQRAASWSGAWCSRPLRCTFLALLMAVCVALRLHLLNGHTTPNFTYMDNPLWFAPTVLEQVLGTTQVHSEYTRLLLWPQQLSCDYSPKCLAECTTLGLCMVKPLAAYSGAVGLVVWAALRQRRNPGSLSESLPLFALGLTAVTIAPGAHVFLKVGLLVAERLLYVPSMGVCMLCGWAAASLLIEQVPAYKRQMVTIVVVCVVAAGAWRCFVRNEDWRDADALYAAALTVCPESARINNNVGTRLLRGRKAADSIPFFDAAVEAVPTFSLALHNRGLAGYMTGDKSSAVEWYRRSLETPDTSNAMTFNVR